MTLHGKSFLVSYAPTVDTDAMIAGDSLGTDAKEITDIAPTGQGGVVTGITVTNKGITKVPITLHFFVAEPTNSTITNNLPFAIADADLPLYRGFITLPSDAEYWKVNANNAVGHIATFYTYVAPEGSFFIVPVTEDGVTFGSVSDLNILLHLWLD